MCSLQMGKQRHREIKYLPKVSQRASGRARTAPRKSALERVCLAGMVSGQFVVCWKEARGKGDTPSPRPAGLTLGKVLLRPKPSGEQEPLPERKGSEGDGLL